MGAWVYVRGWLEFSGQEAEAKRIIQAEGGEGWSFPEGGWLDAACFARAVRSPDEVLALVRRVAALPATDEDGDRVSGLLLVFDERDGTGQAEWQVRDGQVFVDRAPSRYDYLRR
ncbi:hypothetical protein [Actinomadura oligospora]|uniref:hypothetical protein n=1 Tax=Actinomadura oligospora TaxID=111804 RepID=UPI00047DED59|nr:hypothetical protein [Actinomadura oligospora]